MPQTYAPIIAGAGGILLEAPDTLPESGVLALAVDAAGKMSSVAFPETTRETLGLATTDSPTFAGATFSGQSLTGSQATSLLDLATTWNTTGTPSAFKLNVTDTASNAASLLMDLQVGGASRFKVRKNGYTTIAGNAAIQFDVSSSVVGSTLTLQNNGGNNFRALNAGSNAWVGLSTLWVSVEQFVRWGILGGEAADLFLHRDAAATLAQRNGTNGQKSRLYKTYTSATSGEWLELDAATDASNFDIAASIGSAGGTARGIRIGGKNAAGTFAPWMSFATNGEVAINSTFDFFASAGSSTSGQLIATSSTPRMTGTISGTYRGEIGIANTNSYIANNNGAIRSRGTRFEARNFGDSAYVEIECLDLTCSPSASRTLSTNGQLTFEATSNTSITIKYRGSDGVTRSSVLTMA